MVDTIINGIAFGPNKDFSGLELSDIDLSGINLSGSDFSGTTLNNIDFSNAVLEGCNFNHATITATDFTSANLSNSWFHSTRLNAADLTSTDFSGSELVSSILAGCTYQSTNFNSAIIEITEFSHDGYSSMDEVSFVGTRLTEVDFWSQDLSTAKFGYNSYPLLKPFGGILPKGFALVKAPDDLEGFYALIGPNISIKNVHWSEDTPLQDVNLSNLDLSGSKLYAKSIGTNQTLKNAIINGVTIDVTGASGLYDTLDLSEIDAQGITISGAYDVDRTEFTINLENATVDGLHFSQSEPYRANISTSGSRILNFTGSYPYNDESAHLFTYKDQILEATGIIVGPAMNLDNLDLTYVVWNTKNIEGASFRNSDFRNSNFQGAHDFSFAGTDLSGANFKGVDLTGVTLQGAVVVGTIIDPEFWYLLDATQLEAIYKNSKTTGEITLVGEINLGSTITIDTSELSDVEGLGELSYEWYRDDERLEFANSDSYLIGWHDIDAELSAVVRYTDGFGFTEEVSSIKIPIQNLTLGTAFTLDTLIGLPNYGSNGNDLLKGSIYDDHLYGKDGNDRLNGNAGDDNLFGGNGDDTLNGGEGDDYLDGGSGDDYLDGGEGDDTYVYRFEDGVTTITDTGQNTLHAISRTSDGTRLFGEIYFDDEGKLVIEGNKLTAPNSKLVANGITDLYWTAGDNSYSPISTKIYNSSIYDLQDDLSFFFIGTHQSNTITTNTTDKYTEVHTGDGNDIIQIAGSGESWINAGEGDDKIVGGIGVDYIVADNFYTSNTGADLISGGGGDDVIYLAASEAYSRWLSAKNVSSKFQTGTQELINLKNFLKTEDVVDGGADADTIHLDSGNIALFLHDAFSAFHEEASLSKDSYGNKSVQRIDNIENIFGYDGDNLIDLTSPDYSLAGQNIKISGGNGDDIIWGSDANENILGDAGNDVLFGGAGTNILTGGSGADDFQFTHTSVADTISDYSKADGDVLKFYVRPGSPEATAEFSITGNQLVWGDSAITLDGYTNLSGNDLTIKKQIIGSTLLEDVLITELPPSLSISLSKDAKTFIADGLNAERDVQIVSDKLSGFYKGINGANAIFRTLENETVTKQDAVTVSNQGIFITSDAGYTLSLEFTNFSPSSLNQLQTMFENANDINDINLTGGFKRITLADPDGSTLLKLNHSSSGITWENPNADAGVVDTFMIKGSFENQIKDYIDFIKNVDAAANTQQSPNNFMNFVEEVNSLIQLDGISATSDGKTVFDFTAKEDGTLTLTLMGTGGDHVLEFGLGLDGIEKIGTDIIALAGGEDAFFNMLIEDQMSNNIQQYLSDISNLDEIELTLGYDFANKELIDIKLTDFSRLDSLNVDPFILKDLKIFDSSTDELRITTVANPTGEVAINLVGYSQYEVSSAIETVSSYAYNDFGMLLEELFIPDQNLLML